MAEEGTVARREGRLKNCEYILNTIQTFMDEIQSGYGDKIPAGNQEMIDIENKIAALKEKVKVYADGIESDRNAEAQAQNQQESMSNEWIEKFKPYTTGLGQPGYNEDKYFISSGTVDAEELKKRKAIYDELLPLFEEYKKVEFPAGKTYELESIEEELERNLKEFPEIYQNSLGSVLSGPGDELDQKLAFLDRDKKWVDDPKEKPPIVGKDDIKENSGSI